jgi:hypothetical protein
MEFFHGIVALLAFVVLVLAGMVAWLYMQQTRLLQAVNALAIAISTPPPPMLVADPAPKAVEAPSEQEVVAAPAEEEEDDRVSVHEEEEESTVAPQEVEEIVDYAKKTIVELRDILTQKGIPFNKSDKKTTLVSLIQATA